MRKTTCKNPKGEPTRKQTWAFFCMTKVDIRNETLTRQQVSNMIGELKSKGETTLNGKLITSRSGKPSKKSNGSKKSDSSWALDLIRKAEAAGADAMEDLIASKKVKPMVVQEHANPMDDSSPVTSQWVVDGGPCGFASIRVMCKNGASRKFINQLKKAGLAGDENSHTEWSKSSYYGGYMKSFSLIGGQSLAYKTAYAGAYSKVLEAEGINTWIWTRMD